MDEVPELVPAADDPYARPRIPLTLLTGYLGAGKSTLLEYILTADHGYRIAVCMNDFGDTTDIEAKSLTLCDPSTGEQSTSFLSLPNGCLCCSVKDLGIAAIEEMVVNQRDKVDWVMVELTGVADPGPIAKSFWENEEMGDLVLDGIVCVVDSKNFLKQLDDNRPGEINEAQRQLAASDVILLNKVDLVDAAQLDKVRSRVTAINPTLRIHDTVKGNMPLDRIFNLHAYSKGKFDTVHDHPSHVNSISTVLIPLPRLTPTQWSRLNLFLENVLWTGKLDGVDINVLRTKGLIHLDDGREMVLQGVMDIFEIKQSSEPDEAAPGKIVFIGRGVQDLKPALISFVDL
ncbi:CobW/HypB/UreG, nucleotide-binding domain-domain-containing protein [Kockovaella imperatae]|uniref:CobW/HypB/UreG, nucleotide-binding domain-domain-containing protein n=1 Tax=Kockovaella imperatae TaxID=4999 RepID=A0A1Y1U5Z0_9TREE|nr:CobW/HypB/UreG, nucleotide-binding domain-domain-containing protein [Kockovaella imperatae]ORX33450.1 CobW/HypB/UreG, nucleotide-binding domain-domain-containing protein [Kockovaella imperatae]